MNWGKNGKLGEIGLDDEHTLLVFSNDDRKYIQTEYVDKLVIFNNMVEEVLDELYYMKKEVDRMVHYKNKKKMLWGYGKKTAYIAGGFYENFQRLESHLENVLGDRRKVLEDFHNKAVKFHNDQTISDKRFAPTDSAEKADLITEPGIGQAAKQISSETFKKWEFFGLGRSLNPVYMDQNKLFDQIARYYIKSHGSFASIGDVIRLMVISPGDLPDSDIGELCVADSIDGGNILFRVVLDKLVHHDPEDQFLCNSSNVYLVSRR